MGACDLNASVRLQSDNLGLLLIVVWLTYANRPCPKRSGSQ